MAKTITKVIRVDNETKKLMNNFYEPMKREKTPPYAIFQADTGDIIVTLYESGKAMFQGVSADIESSMWENIKNNKEDIEYFTDDIPKKEIKKEEINLPLDISSVGSDEVGTGDYYGPIVVTASFVSKDNIPFLTELGVKDSKKLSDEQILKIVPIETFTSILLLPSKGSNRHTYLDLLLISSSKITTSSISSLPIPAQLIPCLKTPINCVLAKISNFFTSSPCTFTEP